MGHHIWEITYGRSHMGDHIWEVYNVREVYTCGRHTCIQTFHFNAFASSHLSLPPTSHFLPPLSSSHLSLPPTSHFLPPLTSSHLSLPPTSHFLPPLTSSHFSLPPTSLFLPPLFLPPVPPSHPLTLTSSLTLSIIPMSYYGRNDIPLGEFLQRYCFRYMME